jgi:DNA (cytosine-5)-methyltransferase 1
MRVGSLFAGIGGFDLAARWMGWQTAWVSEIDPYASAVLKKHWPDAPNLGDITKITNPPPVDILVGGFPCQDISTAGKGAGIGGARSGLWKHYARLIDEIRPKYVVAENSAALRSRGLQVVIEDLDAIGYDAEWNCIPAAFVGAPHKRNRMWVVAYPHSVDGAQRIRCLPDWKREVRKGDHREHSPANPRAWVENPSALYGGADGVPYRVDRGRCCGNALVPHVAFTLFTAIDRYERGL